MKVTVRKFDFVNERVIEYEREIPDEPSETPLLKAIRKKQGKLS